MAKAGLNFISGATHAQFVRAMSMRHLLRPWALIEPQRSPVLQELALLRLRASGPPTHERELKAWQGKKLMEPQRRLEAKKRRAETMVKKKQATVARLVDAVEGVATVKDQAKRVAAAAAALEPPEPPPKKHKKGAKAAIEEEEDSE